MKAITNLVHNILTFTYLPPTEILILYALSLKILYLHLILFGINT